MTRLWSSETSDARTHPDRVFLLVLSGELADANKFVATHYPGCECVWLSKRELREGGWRGQIKTLRKLRGQALVLFRQSLSEMQEPQLALWLSIFHRCRTTVWADSEGHVFTHTSWTLLFAVPMAIASAISDLFVFVAAWLLIHATRIGEPALHPEWQEDADLDLAYLYPYPMDTSVAGGALSHVQGFLSGVAAAGASCEIFTGRPLPVQGFPSHLIPARRSCFLFHESRSLSYNLRFALAVYRRLRGRKVRSLYQRHGRFVVAGALLSKICGIPFILEYNASEVWMADHWDPARFRRWLSLCEEASLACAHRIVVVSEPLKQELLQRGIPEERILINPNAVDPSTFRPGCGGAEIRTQLRLAPSDVVIGFVGTFHYWHGIKVLEHAIRQILQGTTGDPVTASLRFLLVGDGLLRAEMMRSLEPLMTGRIFFTGPVPHTQVAAYLDAADILVSPHVPMPDGRPFFGSPTKLFEYMAMGKGIIASDLDQLSRVLSHGRTAWLVEPGNVPAMASAILLLAKDRELRRHLGQNARASALAEHTWQQNAERVLAHIHAPSLCEMATNTRRKAV